MPRSDQNDHSPLRLIVYALLIMSAVGAAVAFWNFSESIWARREALQQVSERGCTDPEGHACHSASAEGRAAAAAEDIVDLGLWQMVSTVLGLIFVGLTLRANRDAVRVALQSVENARDDAAEQAHRFDRQLAIATQNANAAGDMAKALMVQAAAYLQAAIGGKIIFTAPVCTTFGTIVVVNTGASPAFNVRGNATLSIQTANLNEVNSHDSIIRGDVVPSGKEGIGHLFWDALPHLNQKVLEVGDQHWMILRGTLIWDDAFDNERTIHFKLVGKAKDEGTHVAGTFTEVFHTKQREPDGP